MFYKIHPLHIFLQNFLSGLELFQSQHRRTHYFLR